MPEAVAALPVTEPAPQSSRSLDTGVSVTIAAHGSTDRLQRCLQSLTTQSLRPQEILVMLCSPSSQIAAAFPPAPPATGGRLTVVTVVEPILYAAAQNQLIQRTETDFVCCLNDDVVLAKRYLEIAVRAFACDPRIGMVTGKILRPDGRTLDGTGQFVGQARKAMDRGYRQRDRGQFDRPGYVFGPGGAAPIFRRRMLEMIALRPREYFDESFGMYYEDLDLAWRAQRAGWRAYYVPQAVAYHERGASSGIRHSGLRHRLYLPQLPDPLVERAVLNRYRTIRRNDSWLSLIRHLPATLAYELCQWGYLLARSPRLFLRCASRCLRLLSARENPPTTHQTSRVSLTHTAA